MSNYIELGKKIYNMNNPREVRRMAVFVARAILHNSGMQKLESFFKSQSILEKLISESPFPLEQVTRAFFYKSSTFSERSKLIQEHFEIMGKKVNEETLFKINNAYNAGCTIWEQDFGEEIGMLKAEARFESGQRKEGLSSIELNLYKNNHYVDHIYQIMYWFARDEENKESLYIGAMQGPNMSDAKNIVKHMTKVCHGYRTKNLVFHITQTFARVLEFEKIYAVTNEGYYANNHARVDRKLKTSFSDFWQEAGGTPCSDKRFYSLPLLEMRKTMEEVPTRKRAVYRKRFNFLDEMDNMITASVKNMMK